MHFNFSGKQNQDGSLFAEIPPNSIEHLTTTEMVQEVPNKHWSANKYMYEYVRIDKFD